jgi:membrane protein implicated in regulation of membrane protease activity
MEWLSDNAGAVWLGLTFFLGAAEIVSGDLILIMLAAGAFVGFLAAVIGLPVGLQVVAAAGASVAMLALLRPNLVKRMHGGPELRLGHGKLVGRQAVVVQDITALTPGRVRLAGEIWTAEPYDDSMTIAVGETVEVLDIRGATAYVHPVPRLDEGPADPRSTP